MRTPKVLFNARTGKYVMWMHLDADKYTVSEAGVAVADKPQGPFRFVRSFRPLKYDYGYKPDCCNQRELGNTYRDMNLFLDDDGRAYVFYASEHNRTMYVARLNKDFTGIEEPAVLGTTWARILIGEEREAPAPFKHQGKYYLFTSGCTGWLPNKAAISVASNPLGPYVTQKENPMVGPDADLTFRSQSTFVLPVQGKPGAFILLLDRWNPKQLSESRYVWLPFRIGADGVVRVVWRDRWRLLVFDTELR
ncbi:MAG: glycoside hydrolase family 43 protein [Rhodospirillales bacterium]